MIIAAARVVEEMKDMSEAMQGALLMRLFFLDLLGFSSVEAKILNTAVENGLTPTKRVVTYGMKCIVFSSIVCVNLFFLYSCILYASSKSSG